MKPVKRADPSDFTAADPGGSLAEPLPFAPEHVSRSRPPESCALPFGSAQAPTPSPPPPPPLGEPAMVRMPGGLKSLGEPGSVAIAPSFVAVAPSHSPAAKKPFKWGWDAAAAERGDPTPIEPAAAPARSGGEAGKSGLSLLAASDLAADRERPRGHAASEPRSAGVARRNLVELVYLQPGLGARLDKDRALTEAAGLGGVRRAAEEDAERQRVLRVLSCAEPADGASLRARADAALFDLDRLELPLVLLLGELRPVYDELETLRITCAAAQPFAPSDKRLAELTRVGQDLLAAPLPPAREVILGTVRQIEQCLPSASGTQRYVMQQVQRVLCEQRLYKKRTVFGALHLRVDLALPRAERPLTAYLDANVAEKLPLLPSIPVVALGELRPREDALEPQAEAFSVLALGRKLDLS